MSFYLGKDTNNKAVMHITKGYRTSNQLRGGILEDTIFHTDLPYVQYTVHKATISPINDNYTDANYGLSLPIATLDKLGQYSFCFVVEHSGRFELYETYQPNMTLTRSTGPGNYRNYSRFLWSNSSFNSVSSVTNSNHRYPALLLSDRSAVTNIWVVILDTGITHTTSTNSSETMAVGRGRLDVGGTSLATFRYVTPVPVNNTDPIVYTPNGGSIQFVNFYVGVETSLSITSESGRSIIRSGDKKIFDSGLARGKVFFDKIDILNFPDIKIGDLGSQDDMELASGMQDGDLFTFINTSHISNAPPMSETVISLGVFRPNTSIITSKQTYASEFSMDRRIVCTGDGRLLFRTTIHYSPGGVGRSSATFHVTRYK